MRFVLCLVSLVLAAWVSVPGHAEDPRGDYGHAVAGRVVDAEGAGLAGVSVALLDAATGQPIHAPSGQRFGRAMAEAGEDFDDAELHAWRVAITDGAGRFAFDAVVPGTYRLVAQSWHDWDRETRREVAVPAVTEVWETRAQVVHLRGVAEDVVVPSAEAGQLMLAPIGAGTLHLEEKNGNGGYVAVLSTQPLAADPILMFMAWDANFLSHALVAHHAPTRDPMIYRGLPTGELHAAMFFYDNNPGAAGGSVVIEPGLTAELRPHATASWSNGRKDPPPRLAPLTDKLIEHGWAREDVLGPLPERTGRGNLITAFNHVLAAWGPLDRRVELPDGSVVSVADFLAAAGYRDLQKFKR